MTDQTTIRALINGMLHFSGQLRGEMLENIIVAENQNDETGLYYTDNDRLHRWACTWANLRDMAQVALRFNRLHKLLQVGAKVTYELRPVGDHAFLETQVNLTVTQIEELRIGAGRDVLADLKILIEEKTFFRSEIQRTEILALIDQQMQTLSHPQSLPAGTMPEISAP